MTLGRLCMTPSQGRVELSLAHQFLNVSDSHVSTIFYISGCETYVAVSIIELLRSLTDVPFGAVGWKHASDFVAIHPITTGIRSTARRIFHSTTGHDFFHHVSNLSNTKVLFSDTDVKCLFVNGFNRSF